MQARRGGRPPAAAAEKDVVSAEVSHRQVAQGKIGTSDGMNSVGAFHRGGQRGQIGARRCSRREYPWRLRQTTVW